MRVITEVETTGEWGKNLYRNRDRSKCYVLVRKTKGDVREVIAEYRSIRKARNGLDYHVDHWNRYADVPAKFEILELEPGEVIHQ